VQGVAEQRHRAGEQDDERLHGRGEPEPGERDPQRAHALTGRLHRRVDLAGTVVRMRRDGVPDPVGEAAVRVVVLVVGHAGRLAPELVVRQLGKCQ